MTYPPQQHAPDQQYPVRGHVAWHPPVIGGGGFPQQVAASTPAPGMGRGMTISLGVIIAAAFAIITMLVLQRGEESPAVIDQGSATGRLLSISDTGITILPKGGEGQSFTLDGSIPRSSLAALNASKADVQVKYDRTDDGKIATAVTPAPDPAASRAKLEGLVTFLSDSRLSVRQADGSVSNFVIEAQDRTKLDIAHLREHQQSASPIRVFYDGAGSKLMARSYEDAS